MPGYFMNIGPGSEKTRNLEKYPHNPEGKLWWTGEASFGCVSCTAASILERMYQFRERRSEERWWTMHFTVSGSSMKMMMNPIISANDFRIVLGICDHLGKITGTDLGSRQNTASVVLTPGVSETVALCRPCAADNFSSCAPTAEGNLLTRASLFWEYLACRKRKIDGRGKPSGLFSNQQTRKAVVERANEKTDTELVLCRIADDAEILKIGEFLQCSAYLVEMLANRPVLGVDNYFEESVLEAELGRSKKYIFWTKKEAWASLWKCQAPATLRYWSG